MDWATHTRNTAVWVDVYERLLLDFLKFERLDLVWHLQFFEDDDDLAFLCQQSAVHRDTKGSLGVPSMDLAQELGFCYEVSCSANVEPGRQVGGSSLTCHPNPNRLCHFLLFFSRDYLDSQKSLRI